jgi:hypothetical protein
MVSSPSGTTASAIYKLEAGRFLAVIKDAICGLAIAGVWKWETTTQSGSGSIVYSTPKPHIVLRTDSDNVVDDEWFAQALTCSRNDIRTIGPPANSMVHTYIHTYILIYNDHTAVVTQR